MKPITECDREERLERALMAIEALSYVADDGSLSLDEFSSKVYMIAHAAPYRCGNPHTDWLRGIEEIEDSLKDIYHPEKALQRASLKKDSPYEERGS